MQPTRPCRREWAQTGKSTPHSWSNYLFKAWSNSSSQRWPWDVVRATIRFYKQSSMMQYLNTRVLCSVKSNRSKARMTFHAQWRSMKAIACLSTMSPTPPTLAWAASSCTAERTVLCVLRPLMTESTWSTLRPFQKLGRPSSHQWPRTSDSQKKNIYAIKDNLSRYLFNQN